MAAPAEAEAAPAPAAAPAAAPAPAKPEYDEALLIKVKGRVQQPPKPDDTERNVMVEKLMAEIQKHQARIKAISETIESKKSGQRHVPPEQKAVLDRLQECKNEFQSLLRSKQSFRDQMAEVGRQRDAMRNELRGLRDKTKVSNLDSLEAKIRELEGTLAHDSLSAGEEKKLQEQLNALNAARPVARQAALLTQKLAENEALRSQIKARLDEYDTSINGVKAAEEAQRAALAEIRSKQVDVGADIPALSVERKECREIVDACRDKMTQIRKEYDEKYREWVKLDKNYNAWVRYTKKKQWEERQAAYKERQAAREAKAAEDTERGERPESGFEPFTAELLRADQTLAYLRSFLVVEEASKPEAAKELKAPEKGMKLLKRDDDLDGIFGGLGKPKPKNAPKTAYGAPKGGAAPAAAAAASSSKAAEEGKGGKKKLTLTLETLQTFLALGVEAAGSTEDIPATIAKVEAKRAEYVEKQKKAKEAPAKKAEAKKAAAEAAEAEAAKKAEAGEAGEAEAEAEPAAAESEAAPSSSKEEAAGADAGAEAAPEDDAEEAAEEVGVKAGKQAGGSPVAVGIKVDEKQEQVAVSLTVA